MDPILNMESYGHSGEEITLTIYLYGERGQRQESKEEKEEEEESIMLLEKPYIKKESYPLDLNAEDHSSQSETNLLQLDSETRSEDSFHIEDERSHIPPESNYPEETIFKGEGECEVCMDVQYLQCMECCKIKVCKNCLKEYIRRKVNLGVIDITCMGSFCDTPLDTNFIMNVTESYISTRLSFLLERRKRSKNQVACPRCESTLTVKDVRELSGKQRRRIECTNCNESVCGRCMLPWHETTHCPSAGIEKWAKKKAGRAKNATKCPQCGVSIATISCCHFYLKGTETKFGILFQKASNDKENIHIKYW